MDALLPVVRQWFDSRFAEGPTPVQSRAWPTIVGNAGVGGATLVAAPTGSGKTLAAFLMQIDRLYREAALGTAPKGVDVIYVSPLKALSVDIATNLERPLREIQALAEQRGDPIPVARVAVRNGDTTASQRASQLKRPAQFLVTTPESLYLLLTAEKSRALLRNVRTVIVDEIHALARDKRGVHLSLTLERLAALCTRRPARIGLSATQRPLPKIGQLLAGVRPLGAEEFSARPCEIIDEGHRRELDLELMLPSRELEAVASTEQLEETVEQIAALVVEHQTTLIFVNTRRLSERLAHMLSERLGAGGVSAHHGSLSKERRLRVEEQLRAGELRALVATASLELGIDIGPVNLVCQIGSPRAIATFLQRVGRSGHTRFATPKGRLFPMTRDELVECSALLRAVAAGRLDCICLPEAPLDILAQQIVAECGAQAWKEDELFELVRRAAPYRELSRSRFDEVVQLMTSGVDTGRGKRAAYLHRDRVGGVVQGRRGARLAALTSGGAIGDVADYRVVEEPGEVFVGTINEDFAIESMAGDVFLLGSTSWRIRRVERGVVRVVNAQGALPSVPFWLGEAPSRTVELSEEVSRLREEVGGALDAGEEATGALLSDLAGQLGCEPAAREVFEYLGAAKAFLGSLPTQRALIVERFFDESGGMQVVVHSPYGGRINRALGLLLRKRFCRSFDFELQAAANDDALVLSLGEQHSFPLSDLRDFMSPAGVRKALLHAVLLTPMFQARWRWNLNRSLVVLRYRGGKRNPPQFQRMEADDVMAAVFPSLAACQDNATGPRIIPEHPLVDQTLEDCLSEAMDLSGLMKLLGSIQTGDVSLSFVDTTEASPLGHEILSGRPYTFLDDAPLEERRTQAVSLRRGLPLEARDLSMLDASAVERVRAEATPQLRDEEELHDLLCRAVALPVSNVWSVWLESLAAQRRVAQVRVGGTWFAVAAERVQDAFQLYGEEVAPALSIATATGCTESREALVIQLLRTHLEHCGPITAAQLGSRLELTPSVVKVGLAQLEADGFLLRGHFDPGAPLSAPLGAECAADGPPEEQVCARRLLARIHRYTQGRLRREIEPVSAQVFMRFLLAHHGVGASKVPARDLPSVVEQLQGYEAAAGAWESEILAARLPGFGPEQLDALCWSGALCWGRLTPRSEPSCGQWMNFSRSSPVTLSLREDFYWLLAAVRGDTSPQASALRSVMAVVEALSSEGALFFSELRSRIGLTDEELEDALWDNVARGLITSDGFSALRELIRRRTHPKEELAHAPRSRLRRGARNRRPREGRWSLLAPSAGELEQPAADELAEAVAEQLLARYGVVFRDLLQRESFTVPWREVLWALRRLEARGLARGGRFIGGFVGEQFALPDAVEHLRRVRREPLSGEVVRLSACDPLNLVGILTPGPRVSAQPRSSVTLVDGAYHPEESAAPSGAAE